MTTAEGGLERVVQHRGTHVEKGLHSRPVPAHLLSLVHALGHDLVNRTLDERGRDRLTTSTPGGIMHQHILVALEVSKWCIRQVGCDFSEAGALRGALVRAG